MIHDLNFIQKKIKILQIKLGLSNAYDNYKLWYKFHFNINV